jgi:hypothetical protein
MLQAMESAPPPGEWHPWYRDKPWLMNWLNDRKSMNYRVLVMPAPRVSFADYPYHRDGHEISLTKTIAWALAPWAEQSYVYAWYVATDTYGRQIAGDSWIEYIENYDRFLAWVSEWMI